MTDWKDYFDAEQRRIDEALQEHFGRRFAAVTMMPPPTRTETIHALWAETKPYWPEKATKAGLVAVCEHLGKFHFEAIRYGDTWAIECEGVIVDRIPVVTVR